MDKPLKYILKNAQQCAGWLTESLNEGGLGIWVWDLETGLVELDETEKEFFGLGHLESPFNAQAIVDQIHPDDVRIDGQWPAKRADSKADFPYA